MKSDANILIKDRKTNEKATEKGLGLLQADKKMYHQRYGHSGNSPAYRLYLYLRVKTDFMQGKRYYTFMKSGNSIINIFKFNKTFQQVWREVKANNL